MATFMRRRRRMKVTMARQAVGAVRGYCRSGNRNLRGSPCLSSLSATSRPPSQTAPIASGGMTSCLGLASA
jgi:hypothetical protein